MQIHAFNYHWDEFHSYSLNNLGASLANQHRHYWIATYAWWLDKPFHRTHQGNVCNRHIVHSVLNTPLSSIETGRYDNGMLPYENIPVII